MEVYENQIYNFAKKDVQVTEEFKDLINNMLKYDYKQRLDFIKLFEHPIWDKH